MLAVTLRTVDITIFMKMGSLFQLKQTDILSGATSSTTLIGSSRGVPWRQATILRKNKTSTKKKKSATRAD